MATNRPADNTDQQAPDHIPADVEVLGTMDDETNAHRASQSVKSRGASDKRPADTSVPPEAAKAIIQSLVADKVTTVSDDEAVRIVESGVLDFAFDLFSGNLDESVSAIFADDNLSEEQVANLSTLFKVAVDNKVKSYKTQLHEDAQKALDADRVALIEKIDAFLNEELEAYFTENAVAIEEGAEKAVLTMFAESVLTGLSACGVSAESFTRGKEEAYKTAIEESKKEAEELTKLVEEKEAQLKSLLKEAAFNKATEDMTSVERETLSQMVESINFTDEDAYIATVKKIADRFVKKSDNTPINESKTTPSATLTEDHLDHQPAPQKPANSTGMDAALNLLKRMK